MVWMTSQRSRSRTFDLRQGNSFRSFTTTAWHGLPKIWKKAHVIALLKPGEDPSISKSYRPISLLSHTYMYMYKLFKCLILNRVAPIADERLIPEQAGYRPGKSMTSQVLNLTQYIEDGFKEGMVTGVCRLISCLWYSQSQMPSQ